VTATAAPTADTAAPCCVEVAAAAGAVGEPDDGFGGEFLVLGILRVCVLAADGALVAVAGAVGDLRAAFALEGCADSKSSTSMYPGERTLASISAGSYETCRLFRTAPFTSPAAVGDRDGVLVGAAAAGAALVAILGCAVLRTGALPRCTTLPEVERVPSLVTLPASAGECPHGFTLYSPGAGLLCFMGELAAVATAKAPSGGVGRLLWRGGNTPWPTVEAAAAADAAAYAAAAVVAGMWPGRAVRLPVFPAAAAAPCAATRALFIAAAVATLGSCFLLTSVLSATPAHGSARNLRVKACDFTCEDSRGPLLSLPIYQKHTNIHCKVYNATKPLHGPDMRYVWAERTTCGEDQEKRMHERSALTNVKLACPACDHVLAFISWQKHSIGPKHQRCDLSSYTVAL
jgi:hypothetical protein